MGNCQLILSLMSQILSSLRNLRW